MTLHPGRDFVRCAYFHCLEQSGCCPRFGAGQGEDVSPGGKSRFDPFWVPQIPSALKHNMVAQDRESRSCAAGFGPRFGSGQGEAVPPGGKLPAGKHRGSKDVPIADASFSVQKKEKGREFSRPHCYLPASPALSFFMSIRRKGSRFGYRDLNFLFLRKKPRFPSPSEGGVLLFAVFIRHLWGIPGGAVRPYRRGG